MLKNWSSLLLIMAMILNAGSVTKIYRFSQPTIQNNAVYMEGCGTIGELYYPQLPVKSVKLVLPIGYQAKQINVTYGKLVPIPKNGNDGYFVKPFTSGSNHADKRIAYTKTGVQNYGINTCYSKDALFPGVKSEESVTTQFKNGIGVGISSIAPVQYNPVRGELYYYDEITVTMETEPIGIQKEIAAVVVTPFTKSMLQSIVDNKEAVADLPLTPKKVDDYEYLIITPETFKNAWTPLVDFNRERGLRTKVKPIKEIQSEMTGLDLADKMRNYIKQEYTHHRIVYVLLGGDFTTDSSCIPIRNLFCKYYDHNHTPDRLHEELRISEIYFEGLDGDWKGNNDKYGLPGTADMFSEVYVGRFPSTTIEGITNCIKKTIKYSKEPVRDGVKKVLGLGEFLWWYTNPDVPIFGNGSVELLIDKKTEYNYTTYGFPSILFDIKKLYDRHAYSTWGVVELTDSVKLHKPSWIIHCGRGGGLNNYDSGLGISTGDLATVFKNDGISANYPVVLSSSSFGYDFTIVKPGFLEQLFTMEYGSVAELFVSNLNILDDDGDDAAANRPFRYTFDALFNKEKRVHYLQMMHSLGKEANIDLVIDADALNKPPYYGIIRAACYSTTLFGDPALSVWTDTPKDMTTLFEYSISQSQFTMKTLPYTWVALADEATGEIFTSQLTGYVFNANSSFSLADSTCLINDEAYRNYISTHTKLKVIVKAHNYIPYSKVITYTGIQNSTPFVYCNNYTIVSQGDKIKVSFKVEAQNKITVSIFNAKGAIINTLINGVVKTGYYSFVVNKNDLCGGVYYCRLTMNNSNAIKSFVVTK